jgi:DNA-binding HxlR family transcriptional regulator
MSETNKPVRGHDPDHPDCRAVAQTLARIGDKWTVLIIGTLSEGPLRYNEIRRAVSGISQRMLTLTLKGLEQDGLVSRTVYPTVPPRVEYQLTDLGQSLTVPLRGIYDWATKHRHAMEVARNGYARRRPATMVGSLRVTPPKPTRQLPDSGQSKTPSR